MSGGGDTAFPDRRAFYNVNRSRTHDYLYDSVFLVSGARDYARTAFKAAMQSAQVGIQPIYPTMFSDGFGRPYKKVYYGNCRLPKHMDTSYNPGYLRRTQEQKHVPMPDIGGKDMHKFIGIPRMKLPIKKISPQFTSPRSIESEGPKGIMHKKIQTIFRESSAQTHPWQPEGFAAATCKDIPEVLYLDKLEWGPGIPYRKGDLPADFHTTEIINKMRHARIWTELVERADFPGWMKKRDAIIEDLETKDWIFREAEIDELQEIRLNLLHKLQLRRRQKDSNRTAAKLTKLWDRKKQECQRKVDHIRLTRDRELRKLHANHSGGGRLGLVERMRAARGHGSVTKSTVAAFAPLARNGYHASGRHANIQYDPSLLLLEDHEAIAAPPTWLGSCGQDLTHSCSGGHLPRDPTVLCARFTKWSDQFLEALHKDLMKARLGAMSKTAGPLRILKLRRPPVDKRPDTAQVDMVADDYEHCHQSALTLQRVIRGRAVQLLMYEGRTRAAELTEELKTTHGLQKEDKERIDKEETMARNYRVLRTEAEQKESAISGLVEELCGGAVSAALDFLEKELRRLREERRQHAYILVAVREKTMREAAEAGRRQKEERRRREHDEMFKHILGVTQETVDVYLKEIIAEGIELSAEEEAVQLARRNADKLEQAEQPTSTLEENELVAELVQQFLLPEAHKAAARRKITAIQDAQLATARREIFGVLDGAMIKEEKCIRCGAALDEMCRCRKCKIIMEPVAKAEYRDDPRKRMAKGGLIKPEKTMAERFPPYHEFRCMLNTLIDEVVAKSKQTKSEHVESVHLYSQMVKQKLEAELEGKELMELAFNVAMGVEYPTKKSKYHYTMSRHLGDVLEKTSTVPPKICCPAELPSALRRRVEAEQPEDLTCRCEELDPAAIEFMVLTSEEKSRLLPSQIRQLEELKLCKCDAANQQPAPTPTDYMDGSDINRSSSRSQSLSLGFTSTTSEKESN